MPGTKIDVRDERERESERKAGDHKVGVARRQQGEVEEAEVVEGRWAEQILHIKRRNVYFLYQKKKVYQKESERANSSLQRAFVFASFVNFRFVFLLPIHIWGCHTDGVDC